MENCRSSSDISTVMLIILKQLTKSLLLTHPKFAWFCHSFQIMANLEETTTTSMIMILLPQGHAREKSRQMLSFIQSAYFHLRELVRVECLAVACSCLRLLVADEKNDLHWKSSTPRIVSPGFGIILWNYVLIIQKFNNITVVYTS